MLQPAGLLQPLDVPSQVWADISLDFVEGLPKVHRKSVILTVVDRFSKCAHFIPLGYPYTVASVARAFFADIVRLHGFPVSIMSNRGLVFTSNVWQDQFKMAGVHLRMSMAFHPRRTASPRLSTRPSPCTCTVSPATGHVRGFSGCRGASTVTTRPSTPPSGRRRSR